MNKRDKTVTVEDVLGWRPCYTDAKVRRLMAERKHWTALDFLKCRKLKLADRCWAVQEIERARLIDLPEALAEKTFLAVQHNEYLEAWRFDILNVNSFRYCTVRRLIAHLEGSS